MLPTEIAEVGWYRRDRLPAQPATRLPALSAIAIELITGWLAGHGPARRGSGRGGR